MSAAFYLIFGNGKISELLKQNYLKYDISWPSQGFVVQVTVTAVIFRVLFVPDVPLSLTSTEMWTESSGGKPYFLPEEFQAIKCLTQYRTNNIKDFNGPFTLAIFAAISSAILRRFQIARVTVLAISPRNGEALLRRQRSSETGGSTTSYPPNSNDWDLGCDMATARKQTLATKERLE